MTIYKWSTNERLAGYLGADAADERRVNWPDTLIGEPLPPLAAWRQPRLTQYLGDGARKRKPKPSGDAPSSGLLHLISQRAVDALADIWKRHAILYPVVLDDTDEPFYMVVVQTVIDALDRAASSGTLNKYGGDARYFASVHEWVFREDQLGDAMLFQLPDSNVATYVTEEFKQRVIAAKLKGFCLKRHFWEEKPFCS